MQANVRYTIREVLEHLEIKNIENLIGEKVLVVGGIRVTNLDRLIRFTEGRDVEVIVGNEVYTIALTGVDEAGGVSDAAKEYLEKKGEKLNEKAEEVQERKLEEKRIRDEKEAKLAEERIA